MPVVAAMIAILSVGSASPARPGQLPPLVEIRVRSTLDGTHQPSRLWAPERAAEQPTPLFVFVHSWSGDYRQPNDKWQQQAVQQGWIYLHPNFRGVNEHPEACGSNLARQDVLDAVDDVRRRYNVDDSRIYLAGVSGGGHMAMLMAAYHADRFSAVSAWVGISDLAAWHRFHSQDGPPSRYARMIEACCGGPPGASAEVDAEYEARSPIFHLHQVGDLPLDLNAGVHDGRTGSVPIHHSLRAFNVVARAGRYRPVTETEIRELWTAGKLSNPTTHEESGDDSYGRAILLRRHAGPARVTLFEGGHESLPDTACTWLAAQTRKTKT